ncbi:MAG: tyrosine--tRNA ligase [Bacteroidetes bacterium]|nr:tyrosine--tRNA ligase [Bacteroidota bacterium]
MNFFEELKWRGMVHDYMPGTEEQLMKEMTTAYVGIDPTADSLHIGHLVSVMLLKHLQLAGHKPIVLVGGATGMIGDPSGKSEERNLLTAETINNNLLAIKKQLMRFLDFGEIPNQAEIVNNYDWMKEFSFLDFIRDVGKHISVNYMMAKDSVKKRLETGLSFTEFTYQLVQGYDFLHLYEHKNCKLQMGGSDQWGNIVTGTELIRRKANGEAFALTCPLITKSDGGKFGKTEKGNVWLDPEKTSPYQFYQFWMNVSDEDAFKYMKIFTLLRPEKMEALWQEHQQAPHLRLMQKTLSRELTQMVHGEEQLQTAEDATHILFGAGTSETLSKLDEPTFLAVFDGVPMFEVPYSIIENGVNVLDLISTHCKVFPSKGEARRMLEGGGLGLNKNKVSSMEATVSPADLINRQYLLIQKGKKNYVLLKIVK